MRAAFEAPVTTADMSKRCTVDFALDLVACLNDDDPERRRCAGSVAANM